MNEFAQEIANDNYVKRNLTNEKFSIGFPIPQRLWEGTLWPPMLGFRIAPQIKGAQLKGAIELLVPTHVVHVQVCEDQNVSVMFLKK